MLTRRLLSATAALCILLWAASGPVGAGAPLLQTSTLTAAQSATPVQAVDSPHALVNRYCVRCHNDRTRSGGLALDSLDMAQLGENPVVWENVVRKLRAGLMPPAGQPRPDEATYDGFRSWVESELDRAAALHPDPGRTEVFHRLNRTEYQNAVRDLLALEVDATEYLPADNSSYGFDNIAGVLKISPTLTERHLAAASTLSRLAIGTPARAVDSKTFRMAADGQQDERVEGLPFGTRGGLRVSYTFPQDAEYVFRLDVGGANRFGEPERVEITIDETQVGLFTVEPREVRSRGSRAVGSRDNKLEIRVAVKAGLHPVGVAFYEKSPELLEQVREPFENPRVMGNDGGRAGSQLLLIGLTILGPYNATGPGDTASRRRILICQPADPADEARCAKTILSTLMRRGYRGMGIDEDLQVLVDFYARARADGGTFEAGLESAIARLLVDPLFLFRIEADPRGVATSDAPVVYALSDVQLASRLSFFLWSSIPDDELLDLALNGRLRDPGVLEAQTTRMLADPRSESLTTNFAAQWLLLRNVATVRPAEPYLLAFDETLRTAFQRESELFVDSVVRENRIVMELLTANYTFLNERLARHYEIPNIEGSHFRRVALPADSPRRGLLGKGSILTLTSHAIRTSPVIRGKWVLNNILGTPPPDPPPDVPALDDKRTQAKVKTMRERMKQHQASPVCSACHSMIDPAGFALESFDAIGRWREVDESFNPIDTAGALPDGSKFDGVVGLRDALVRRPERFVNTVTEKLMTYALGRGLEVYDMPAVRGIVRNAASDDYRMQSIVLGVVKSYPFLNRRTEAPAEATATAQSQ